MVLMPAGMAAAAVIEVFDRVWRREARVQGVTDLHGH